MPGLVLPSSQIFVPPSSGLFVNPSCPVNWAHPLNTGLVIWWKVVNNPGWRGSGVWRDLIRGSGHSPNDGIFTNYSPPTIAWKGTSGRTGTGSITFNPSGPQYISTTTLINLNASSLYPTGCGFWVKGGDGGDNLPLITITGSAGTIAFHTNFTNAFIGVQPVNQALDIAGSISSSWTWYYFQTRGTGFTSNNDVEIYKNGNLIGSSYGNFGNNQVSFTVTGFSVGYKGGTTGSSVTQSFDDVRLYNRWASSTRVQSLYRLSCLNYPGAINYLGSTDYFPSLSPVANFSGTPTSGTTPLSVTFTDSSTNTPTSWAWDFGDGGTDTVQNPTHVYTTMGVFTVKLTATNAFGSNTKTLTAYITAKAPITAFQFNSFQNNAFQEGSFFSSGPPPSGPGTPIFRSGILRSPIISGGGVVV